MGQVDAVHGGAEADRLVEEDDLLVLGRETVGQAADQVQLRTDGPLGAAGGGLQGLDDVLRRADVVRRGDDLVLALGVDQDVHAGDALADVVDRVQREAAVHGAVAAPQDHLGGAQLVGGQAAVGLVGVVDHTVVEGHAHIADGGVAAQVLVGQEEDLLSLLEGPVQRALGVGGGADRAAVLAGEGLDVGGRVHVRDGHHLLGNPGLGQDVPALGYLLGRRHIGHRAAGRQVGEDHLLVVAREDVGGLGHEVDTAEDDVLRVRPGGRVPRELEGVAGHIGELDDLVALVVVPEDEDLVAELLLGRAGALDEAGVGGGRQITGALHTALALRVGLAAEEEQGQRSRLDIQGLGGGHDTHPLFSADSSWACIRSRIHAFSSI